VMNNTWLEKNTFHYSEFKDLSRLMEEKTQKNLKISLCLPTLNEEKSIAKEIIIMKSELMTRYRLLDEIIVIDSGSTDRTRAIAREFGADVYKADDILPHLEKFKGKGENLWKALYITQGDIIIYLDADIKNIHHRFAYGLLGPLLLYDNIKFAKAFYDRPLFSLFFPDLTQLMQPLSGEYAGYREIFEQIPFPIGYGIETSMNIDIYKNWGLDVMAQVDLDRRIHSNQGTKALGRMAFVILKTFINRKIKLGLIELNEDMYDEMIQYNLVNDRYEPEKLKLEGLERPPMIEIPEYREKFGISGKRILKTV
jgi:glucosyl-3-phosphoglycerate synthase